MEKTKAAVKRQLKEQWENACNGYLNAMLSMWELDPYYGYWSRDMVGTVYFWGEMYVLDMDDIIYIVEHDIDESTVLCWCEYVQDATEFGLNVPNLPAWCNGCPRTSKDGFDKLRKLKKDFYDMVDAEKERLKNDGKNGF